MKSRATLSAYNFLAGKHKQIRKMHTKINLKAGWVQESKGIGQSQKKIFKSHDDTQNFIFCRLHLVVETSLDTLLNEQTN